jgi:hypothetical protein
MRDAQRDVRDGARDAAKAREVVDVDCHPAACGPYDVDAEDVQPKYPAHVSHDRRELRSDLHLTLAHGPTAVQGRCATDRVDLAADAVQL